MTIKYFIEFILMCKEDYNIIVYTSENNMMDYDDLTEEQRNIEVKHVHFSSYLNPFDYKIVRNIYIYTY